MLFHDFKLKLFAKYSPTRVYQIIIKKRKSEVRSVGYNSYIQAVLYRGNEKDADKQIDSQDYAGPLDQQIIQTMRFAKRYNAVRAKKDIGRIDFPQYSMRAIFEAIVNAVVH